MQLLDDDLINEICKGLENIVPDNEKGVGMKKETTEYAVSDEIDFQFKHGLSEEDVKSIMWISAKGTFCHLVKECYGKECSVCDRKIKQLLGEKWYSRSGVLES